MAITEVRIHDTNDTNLLVHFTAVPPFSDARNMRRIFTEMEFDTLRKWRYSPESGRGSYQLTEDYSLWGEGGRMWIDTDTNVIHFQAAPDLERIEAGVRVQPGGVTVA